MMKIEGELEMPYVILAYDYDHMDELREKTREDHRKHLRSAGSKLIAAGALLDDYGEKVIGGLALLDTEDREEAKRFAYLDPYETAGIRESTHVIRWRRRWIDGEFKLESSSLIVSAR